MFGKKRKNKEIPDDYKFDWEVSIEEEINRYQYMHDIGALSDLQYSLWQEDVMERIKQIKREIVGEVFDDNFYESMSALEKFLP